MLASSSSGYRSVAMRSVNPSPSRRAIMEVFTSRDKPSERSATKPPPLDLSRTSGAAPPPKRAQTPPMRSTRSRSPQIRSNSINRASTPRPDQIVNLVNFEDSTLIRGVFNSPRSLKVCAENGIHPEELIPKSLAQFEGPGVPMNIAQLRYEHYETRRREKVGMLRAGREALIYEEHRKAPQSARPQQQQRAVVVVNDRNSTTTHAKVAMEKNAKRQLVYERAMKMKADKEAEALRRQLDQERRSINHQQMQEAQRQEIVEARRLRFEDSREHVQHLKRQQEYSMRIRAQRYDEKQARPVDKFQLSAAKEQFMTPQLRSARRSASAGR